MLRSFESFLNKKGSLKPQYIPYCLKWVSDCYHFLNLPLSTRLNSDQKKQFLLDMGKIYEEWQVNQADTALRLYDYFLSQTSLPKTRDLSPDKESWRSLEEKMREALRLRQRSLSTEKTYLLWLRKFGNFVNGKTPPSAARERFAGFSETARSRCGVRSIMLDSLRRL